LSTWKLPVAHLLTERSARAINRTVARKLGIMIYYVSKVFWLIAAPTNALVLISAIVVSWIVVRRRNCVAWSAAAVAYGLVIGTFTPIGLALTVPLESRFFPFSLPDSLSPLTASSFSAAAE